MNSQFRASSAFASPLSPGDVAPARRRRSRRAQADAAFEGRTLAFSLIAAMVSAEVAAHENNAHAGRADDLAALPVADSLDDLLAVSSLCAEETGGALSEDGHQHDGGLNLASLLGGFHHHGAGAPFASRFADPFGGAHDEEHSGAAHGGCASVQMAAAAGETEHAHEGIGGEHEAHSAHGAHAGDASAHAMAAASGERGEHEAHGEAAHEHAHGEPDSEASDAAGAHQGHLASAGAAHVHASAFTSAASIAHAHASPAIAIASTQPPVSASEADVNTPSTDDGSAASHAAHDLPDIGDLLSDAGSASASGAPAPGGDDGLALALLAMPGGDELAAASPPLI